MSKKRSIQPIEPINDIKNIWFSKNGPSVNPNEVTSLATQSTVETNLSINSTISQSSKILKM